MVNCPEPLHWKGRIVGFFASKLDRLGSDVMAQLSLLNYLLGAVLAALSVLNLLYDLHISVLAVLQILLIEFFRQ